MHPNGPGHDATAALIAPALAATLAVGAPPPGTLDEQPSHADNADDATGLWTKVGLVVGGAFAGLMLGLVLFFLVFHRRRT